VKHHYFHWMASMLIAGAILAGHSFFVSAQSPFNPSDNGLGVTPMAPASGTGITNNRDNYGVVPKGPSQPLNTVRSPGWVGGTGYNSPQNYPQSNSPQQNNLPPNNSQQNYPPNNISNNSLPEQYPQTGPQSYPTTNAPVSDPQINAPQNFFPNTPAGQPGTFGPNPVPNGMLNQSGEPFVLTQGTVILARVGSEGVFASEITPEIDRRLNEIKAKMPPEEFELQRDQFEMQRELLIKRSLKARIESKLIYQDVKRDIPAEGMLGVEKQLSGIFEKSEVPKLLKRENAANNKELEEKLKALGSSITQERKLYFEKMLIQEWVRRKIKHDEVPTVAERLQYYETHLPDFTTPAKATWEELTVSKSNYPSKEAAFAALAQLGNRVLLQGEPFAEVAKQGSDGFTASKGGVRDWVAQGSLTDKEIDKALFGTDNAPGLPVGQMSQIIETPQDYSIIRIVQRVEKQTKSFLEAQDEIPKKIIEERSARLLREYLEGLEKRTPIWTVYDGNGGNLKLADRLTDKQR
jgi:hypothetical protein